MAKKMNLDKVAGGVRVGVAKPGLNADGSIKIDPYKISNTGLDKKHLILP